MIGICALSILFLSQIELKKRIPSTTNIHINDANLSN